MNEIIITLQSFQLSKQSYIVEFAAIKLINGELSKDYFHEYLNPLKLMPDDIKSRFELSDSFLADKPTFHDIKIELLRFIGERQHVVFQNRESMKIFEHVMESAWNQNLSECFEKISFLSELIKITNTQEHISDVDEICDYFDIDRSMKNSPSALLDAEFIAEIYINKINQ